MAYTKRGLAARALERTGGGWAARRVGLWRGLLVFNYHRIAERPHGLHDAGVWSATPAELRSQVDFLARNFRLVLPQDLREGPPAERSVMITFDDGYRDNYEVAFPILAEAGVKATFFLATGFIDRPRLPWWDRIAEVAKARPGAGSDSVEGLLTRYKSLPRAEAERFLTDLEAGVDMPEADDLWMTWEMAREMRDFGMAFGGHTVNHPVLARLTEEEQHAEVRGCRERLEAELDVPMQAFSYPVGLRDAFDERTRAALEAEDVELAFSFYGGYARPGHWDAYDIPRVSVGARQPPLMLRATSALPQVFGRW